MASFGADTRRLRISTITTGSVTARTINRKRLQLTSSLNRWLHQKTVRKRIVRYGLITANAAVLIAVAVFVFGSSHSDHLAAATAVADSTTTVKPVDGLTSYNIAASVAGLTQLPEYIAITNQAQSARMDLAVSTNETAVAPKPQIVATALKSRSDITTYVVVPGDTISSIAQKFGVTSDSIIWSNGLTYGGAPTGTKLVIPPINGIVYTVKAGDTVQSLANRFNANADQIVAYNDAELSGLQVGEQVLIPNGRIVQRRVFTFTYGSNGYDPGWCTYYAAAMAHAPNGWGDARTWASYAGETPGWVVSRTPVVGAIVQTTRGNHVGYVQQVSPDGTQIIYSDMNGLRGFNQIGTSGWVSAASGFDGGRYSDVVYIYRSAT